MAEPIRNITIVGGGTAGWLAAAYLSTTFAEALAAGSKTITLIESPTIPTIGVGEASAPGMPLTMRTLGVNETELIRRTNASFKLGGKFVGWNLDAAGRPTFWINPFDGGGRVKGRPVGYYYNAFGRTATDDTFADDFTEVLSPAPQMIAERKGPRLPEHKDYEGPLRYAYHMDALRLAEVLRDLCLARGVRHILADVTHVHVDARGHVEKLSLKDREDHPVELVLDATGFAGVIIRRALGEPFEDFSKYLLADRACAMQLPHADPTSLEPATRATALTAGWVFHVPLFNRIGTGYVFSSRFKSEDEASAEFLAHYGERGKGMTPRIIRWTSGKIRRSWVGNCIAVGLASSFVEPLEATAIQGTETALRWLYSYFPDTDFSPVLRERYNGLTDQLFAEYVDFIALHYKLNNRTDPYWTACREEVPVPDSLASNIELWRYELPSPFDLASEHFFTAGNYMVALFGKGFYEPGHVFPNADGIRRADWDAIIRRQRAARAGYIARAPGHYDLLR
ncbi:MAG: tryptophan 7-halogenase, partial [Alphaproteobacteria bacterium]|nr:tryptophan 7-halogenase [Alphaproteobacteria bacterium]